MSESKLTRATKALLDDYEKAGEPIYYNKISDRFTSGIPDFQGTFHGISFYIELKDKGRTASKLQEWHLERAKKASAEVISTDDYIDIVNFMNRIRVNHRHIVMSRYL